MVRWCVPLQLWDNSQLLGAKLPAWQIAHAPKPLGAPGAAEFARDLEASQRLAGNLPDSQAYRKEDQLLNSLWWLYTIWKLEKMKIYENTCYWPFKKAQEWSRNFFLFRKSLGVWSEASLQCSTSSFQRSITSHFSGLMTTQDLQVLENEKWHEENDKTPKIKIFYI